MGVDTTDVTDEGVSSRTGGGIGTGGVTGVEVCTGEGIGSGLA
ncbi:hypothetical protein [Endozoicomonas atrinae]|nr:hypothetical protein [Endozoicomonas atrinae]